MDDANGAKNCSYACSCNVFDATGVQKVPGLRAGPTRTTAASKERWDFGSHICLGQYALRPTSTAPNCQIEARFSDVQVTHFGTTYHPAEGVETSTSMRETLKRTEAAPELHDALAKALGMAVPPLP